MSRGPGRLQQLMLHELYHNPNTPRNPFHGDRVFVKTMKFRGEASADTSLYRAARGLVRRGWVLDSDSEYPGSMLFALDVPPLVASEERCFKCSAM